VNPFKRLIGGILSYCEHKQIHAFKIQINGRIYYVCARCSGLYLGMFLGFLISYIMLLYASIFYILDDLGTTLLAVLISLPAILDWTSQRLALRESRNAIRFGTALPTGFAFSWYLLSPVSLLVKIPVLVAVLIFLIIFSYIDRRPFTAPSQEETNSINTK
jgi:uncharacterized membrane protein